ncbi:MAG: cysteine desulfurase family protein [Acidimicrobiales bacterium]
MKRAYLDHASTTPPRPEALAAVLSWTAAPAADPGRLHEEGRVVRDLLEEARRQVAALVYVTPREIVFTSGGTEAINAAVWGATRQSPGAPVLFADVEHSAVRQSSTRLAPTETIPVDGTARIDHDALERRLAARDRARPALVHCQWANHEVGTVQPVREIVHLCRAAGVLVHVDAAAACGRLPMDLGDLGADLVSLSGHKIGGLPGAGALVVRRGSRFEPLIVGGEQERARRAGLEAIPALVAFGAAAGALGADDQRLLHLEARRARQHLAALSAAARAVGEVEIVGSPRAEERLPSLLCLGVHGVEAEPVLIGLDRAGVAIHSGSACSSESIEPSPVLEAMGVDASHSLRVSVGWSTTDADIAAFGTAFADVVAGLRGLRS